MIDIVISDSYKDGYIYKLNPQELGALLWKYRGQPIRFEGWHKTFTWALSQYKDLGRVVSVEIDGNFSSPTTTRAYFYSLEKGWHYSFSGFATKDSTVVMSIDCNSESDLIEYIETLESYYEDD